MAKRTTTPSAETPDGQLTNVIDELRDEIRVLRTVVDELREELQYLVLNPEARLPGDEQWRPVRISSMPADPTASDFGERLNSVPAGVIERLRADSLVEKEVAAVSRGQRELF